jgi:phosphate:Na+ symporter
MGGIPLKRKKIDGVDLMFADRTASGNKDYHDESVARQIAVGFTFMPVVNHIILCFPFKFTALLNKVIVIFEKLCPPKESEKPFNTKYLQEQLIDGSVEIALAMAKKEILIAIDLVKSMFEKVEKTFTEKDEKLIGEISESDSKVDFLHKKIILFLARISRKELGEDETKKSMNYLYIENDIESIGDVIDKDIMALAKKMINYKLLFSEAGFKEIKDLHTKVMENIKRLAIAFENEDFNLAKEIKEKYADLHEMQYKISHIQRLHDGLKVSIDTSTIHLDLINYFARINEHVVYIASRIIWLDTKKMVN